jgi:hypothetical protein
MIYQEENEKPAAKVKFIMNDWDRTLPVPAGVLVLPRRCCAVFLTATVLPDFAQQIVRNPEASIGNFHYWIPEVSLRSIRERRYLMQ